MNELVDKTLEDYVRRAKITQTVVYFPGEIVAPNIVAGPTIGGGGQTIGQEILHTKHKDKESLDELAKARTIYLPNATFRHFDSLIWKMYNKLTATPVSRKNNETVINNDIIPAINHLKIKLKPTVSVHNTAELRKAMKSRHIFLRRLKVMTDKNKAEQFRTEYDVLDGLSCDEVPRVHEFGESDRGIWYISDYCDAKTFDQILAEKARLVELSGKEAKKGYVNPDLFLKPVELYAVLLQMISTAIKIKNQISPEQYEELKIDDDYNSGNHLIGLNGKVYFADPIRSTESAKETQGVMSPEEIINAINGKRKYVRESIAFKVAYLAYTLANRAPPFYGSDEVLQTNITTKEPVPFSEQHNRLYSARQEKNLLLPFERDPSKRISLEDWFTIIREDFEDIAGYNADPEKILRELITKNIEEERTKFYKPAKKDDGIKLGVD